MTIGKRRRIFYGLVAAFFILGAATILYVNGWRLDLKTLKLEKVGAIYVRAFPKEAQIFLDNRPVKNASGLLQDGTLINNLFPKTYELKLVAGGYKPWQESISVLPALVSEVKYAVLVPENGSAIATGTVKNFWLLGNQVAAQNNDNALYLTNQKIGAGEIRGRTNDFRNLLIFNPETASYGLLNADTGKKINVDSILKKTGFQKSKIVELIVDPENDGDILIREQKRISMLDAEKQSAAVIYKLLSGEISDVIPATQSLVVWSEFKDKQNISFLVVYDRFLKRGIYGSPTLPGKTLELAWLPTKKIAALQNNGGLYLYDMGKNETTKMADDVKSFALSKDADFLATLENKSLEIFSLADDKGYHRFNLPDVPDIQKLIWYFDKKHLFVAYPDHISLLDTNDGGLRNFLAVANGTRPQYDWDNNQLYFLDRNGVERTDFTK